MTRRAVRLVLLGLVLAGLAAAGWYALEFDQRALNARLRGQSFHDRTEHLARLVGDVRSSQQAYLAGGQNPTYWTRRVSELLPIVKRELDELDLVVTSAPGREAIAAARRAVEEFETLDTRVREELTLENVQGASDLVFADGLHVTQAIVAALDAARDAEHRAAEADGGEARTMVAACAGGAAALALLGLLMLLPTGRRVAPATRATSTPEETRERARVRTGGPVLDLRETPTPTSTPVSALEAATAPVSPPAVSAENGPELAAEPRSPERPVEAAPPPVIAVETPAGPVVVPDRRRATELKAAADLCSDFARVMDAGELPGLLERAAALLDAAGIIIWIADSEGRSLRATLAHGYPAAAIARMPAILREADNATAAAWREAQVRTVRADESSLGAIVAPLVTGTGCIGVVAAEVRHGRELSESMLALARILAAQVATLISTAPAAERPQLATSSG